jgi:hypothetical protein
VDLIEAIHQGNQAAIQRLAANPDALNSADPQGNTPLHYAVAERDLALIERLVKQGAPLTAENLQGETAADWFLVYINSIYNIDPASQLEELKQEIEKNNSRFVTDCLKAKVSRTLRFSRGETLLHIAVEAQQRAIIELLLEGVSYTAIERLLRVTNSRGLTPLTLAQQCCQPGSRVAQEILNYLQAKQCGASAGMAASDMQIPRSLSSFIVIEPQELKALADSLTHPRILADFERLNPLRLTIVKLAYNTALQASFHLLKLFVSIATIRKQQPSIEKLLQQLFGVWNAETKVHFVKKLYSVKDYLNQLIQQQQVDRVIQFSDKKSNVGGWCNRGEDKIFLNPTKTTSVVALVTTLIHEVTHHSDHSYDFFHPAYSVKAGEVSIDLDSAYQLAATGAAEKLTLEQRKRFEIRQLLEEGFSDGWQKNLYQWMALNSAETLAIAIVALATVPVGTAEVISKSRKSILQIQPWFLSGEAVSAPLSHPKPNPTALCQPTPSKALRSPPLAVALLKGFLRPVSPESDVSTCSRSSGERSPGCQLPHLPTLTNAMAALAKPGDSTLQATQTPQPVSSLPLISSKVRSPSSC